MEILTDYSLKNCNSFGVDVKAKCFVEVTTEYELLQILAEPIASNENKLILGGGCNILFTKDYDGLIIKNSIKGISIVEENDYGVLIAANAGEEWDDLVKYCVENGFCGIENLSAIPGTVGAAPVQNIGAYGVELNDVFDSLECIDVASKEKKIFTKEECKFSYRESIFKNELKNKIVVTKVFVKLSKTPSLNVYYRDLREYFEKINLEPLMPDVREAVIAIRNSKLPDYKKFGNAGSFFKNPKVSLEKVAELKKNFPDIKSNPVDANEVKLSAAWLIEKCGYKGRRINYVGVYKNHALIIVNYGGSTGEEIWEFALKIQQAVKEKFDILLEPEVNII